jgi:polyisoprenoid-binding protein YceI
MNASSSLQPQSGLLNQSDVLIKARHSIIAYIAGSLNKFNGHLDIYEDEIEDASVEFQLDVNNEVPASSTLTPFLLLISNQRHFKK